MLERDGRVKTVMVPEATARELEPLLTGHIDPDGGSLITDGHPAYRLIRNHMPHRIVNHDVTYVDGDAHTQNIESYWSLLKRGLYGTFHQRRPAVPTGLPE